MTLEELNEEIRSCTKCRLHETRTQAVPNEGGVDAELMFVGKKVGFRDDKVGLPYQGESGSTLNYVLGELGRDRSEVFLTNLTRCFPPNGRDPYTEELDRCSSYFERELEYVDPEYIIALGKLVSERLMGFDVKLEEMHGEVHTYNTLTYQSEVVLTYNVGAVQYDPGKRDVIVADIKGAVQ